MIPQVGTRCLVLLCLPWMWLLLLLLLLGMAATVRLLPAAATGREVRLLSNSCLKHAGT